MPFVFSIRVDSCPFVVKLMPANSSFCVPCVLLRLIKIAVVLFFCGALSCLAELTWEQKVIRLDVHPLQVEGKTSFHFKNIGTNTVDILAVRTTCGCMKASASTKRVAPGESGTIDAVFNYREKTGPQRKAVAVRTRDSKPVILYVEANIKDAFSLSVKRMDWALSGDRDPKTCRMTNRFETPYNLVSSTSSSDQFVVKLIPIREGFEYEVVVTPKASIIQPIGATITIQSECPQEFKESRTYSFKVVVR